MYIYFMEQFISLLFNTVVIPILFTVLLFTMLEFLIYLKNKKK